MFVNIGRDAQAARLGKRLQPGGDIDAVAEQIAVFDDDIAEVDANAQAHAPVLGNVGVLRPLEALNFDGATHSLDSARKLGDDAVAGASEDPAAMALDHIIDNTAARA